MTKGDSEEVNLEELRRELLVLKDRQQAIQQKSRRVDPYVVVAVIVAIVVIIAWLTRFA
jgi:hypothetical protein